VSCEICQLFLKKPSIKQSNKSKEFMASNAQAGTMTGWGHWGGPKHPGIAMVLATVLSIASFVLEIYHAKEKLKIDATPTDLVAAASFT
jgi:hypothetical protein